MIVGCPLNVVCGWLMLSLLSFLVGVVVAGVAVAGRCCHRCYCSLLFKVVFCWLSYVSVGRCCVLLCVVVCCRLCFVHCMRSLLVGVC